MEQGFETYRRAVMKAILPMLDEAMADRARLAEWMTSVLTGKASPSGRARGPRANEAVLGQIFLGVTEIGGTLASLETIPKLARHSPPKRSRVTKADYLHLMVEAYLGEIYILRERCDRYRVTVTRLYRNDGVDRGVSELIGRLGRVTATFFKPITDQRSEHVHEARLKDNELSRLRMLDVLEASAEPTFAWLRNEVFRSVKAEKVRWMVDTTAEMKRFLDAYFRDVIAPCSHAVVRRQAAEDRGSDRSKPPDAQGTLAVIAVAVQRC